MSIATDIKKAVGKLNPLRSRNQQQQAVAPVQPQQAANTTSSTPITVEAQVISDSTGQFTNEQMTPELIMQRNFAILATVSHNPTAVEFVIGGLKELWRIIGPVAFIFFTAGEVYYYLDSKMQANNAWARILLWGITLLIEIPFAIATYDLSERKKRGVEARAIGQEPPDKDTGPAIGAWFIMASVNIVGQIAFMSLALKFNPVTADWSIYFFIAARVIGVIIGDAYTAFFLLPQPTKLSRILKTQRSQQEGIDQLVKGQVNLESTREAGIQSIERSRLSLRRERREANFMHTFSEMNMRRALQDQQKLLESGKDLPELEETKEPSTEDL